MTDSIVERASGRDRERAADKARDRIYNFSPGPAVLPLHVLREIQRDLLAYPGAGASILEISHRSSTMDAILAETEANLRGLLAIPDHYRVLFMQGGARLQFSMVPINLLRGKNRPAQYIVTGSWGKQAADEAIREGAVAVAWDGAAEGFRRVPTERRAAPRPQRRLRPLHLERDHSGRAVRGRARSGRRRRWSATRRPISCRVRSRWSAMACSTPARRRTPGPPGSRSRSSATTCSSSCAPDLHSMLDYRQYAESRSLLNTPPVFAIYVLMLITRWLRKEMGGLEGIAELNQRKAQEPLRGARRAPRLLHRPRPARTAAR